MDQRAVHRNRTDSNAVRLKYLICVDPDSFHVYSIHPDSQDVVIENDVPAKYRERAFKAIAQLQRVVDMNNGHWLSYSKEFDRYRRRKIPHYLLKYRYTNYPLYICSSTLSLAFAKVQYIQVEVLLDNYIPQFIKNGFKDFGKGELKIELDVGLVTGYGLQIV